MNKKYLYKLNQFVIDYYNSRSSKPLWVVSEFSCSEMSRYIGYHVLNDLRSAKAYILKGNISKSLSHDILLIETEGKFTLIDPTIWQFFKNKKSIFVDDYCDLESAVVGAKKVYTGDWSISEELNKGTLKREVPEMLNIINKNIKNND